MKVICLHCESLYVDEISGIADVYYCRECGEFFEGEELELNEVRKHRERQQEKFMLQN